MCSRRSSFAESRVVRSRRSRQKRNDRNGPSSACCRNFASGCGGSLMYDPTIAKRANDLDSILEAFELEHETSGEADVAAFLPHADDPQYAQVAVELIRVDLERSWARGSRKPLHAYRELTPRLFADRTRLSEIAFEEYRLRKQSGERVSAHDYARWYSIDTSGWPADEDRVDDDDAPISTKTNGSLVRGRAPAFPEVGDTFAGFQLVEQLGRGAFGVVF